MKLLLIGDERKNRRMFSWGFASDPYRVRMAHSRPMVDAAITAESFQAACIDLKMQDDNPAAILEILRRRVAELPVVALVGPDDLDGMAAVKRLGVSAHLVTPFSIESLQETLKAHALPESPSVLLPERSVAETVDAGEVPAAPTKVSTEDDASRRMLELAMRAANSQAAILILGETGTGKTQLAQMIHQHSALRNKSLVTVNCPCLSHELLESDLFGHVRGAFTGAVQDTWGKVAAAEGGTLFLDEIGDLPMALQPKLLRLLQDKQYERVGETNPRRAHVRIVAATNRNLKREVAAGRFREDLYYRLNVISVEVPALRSRPAQILGAAQSFLDGICRQLGKPIPELTEAARRGLTAHSWPGNLRELRNVIERAAILSSATELGPDDFPGVLAAGSAPQPQVGAPVSLHALETAHIQMVVASSSSLEEAARILEIDKSTLYRKRKQMGTSGTTGRETAVRIA